MSRSHKTNRVKISCSLLTTTENRELFGIAGQDTSLLASGVVQVFTSNGASNRNPWNQLCFGVACFTKDFKLRSHFIRVYDVFKKKTMIFQEELYNNFKYTTSSDFFHYFEGENSWIGINFANTEEAKAFDRAIQKYLEEKKRRRSEKRRKAAPPPPTITTSINLPSATISENNKPKKVNSVNKENKKDGKNKKKKKLSKIDIEAPTNFVHLSHVGYGDKRESVDETALRDWCINSGVSEETIKDSNQMEFIRKWVDGEGGIEAVKEKDEVKKQISVRRGAPAPPPPPPQREPPPPPPPPPSTSIPSGRSHSSRSSASSHHGHMPPATTLNRDASRRPLPPPPPIRGHAPPPPPSTPRGHAPAPPSTPPRSPTSIYKQSVYSMSPPLRAGNTAQTIPQSQPRPPQLTSRQAAPTPQALPSMMAPPPPPPPPPPPATGEVQENTRQSNLLNEIESGVTLRSMDSHASDTGSTTSEKGGGAKDDLLSQIRQGMTLKHVEDKDSDEESNSPEDLGSMGDALRQALWKRDLAMRDPSDDESESEDYDSDDWED